ncbi:O-glucosyltransferase rumi homolog [Rhopalosiphum maidis]|uniref:O-glucosyltransferase rumi homolog n=1 Tax=Rhopalosiphum maidis TaxID=43146 RepID=UPI000EFE89E9|nr:O-glucosyltransferase rumi homolog [Rhopalosiphum maidis]
MYTVYIVLFYLFNVIVCQLDHGHSKSMYDKLSNQIISKINKAKKEYTPCETKNGTCFFPNILKDLEPFKDGITHEMIIAAADKGTRYMIFNHDLYRETKCMFPARCEGIEHFLSKIQLNTPDVEFILNTRDWPQIIKHYGDPKPVFSFSKTDDYADIMYPAWSFWSGGPAIKLHPSGLGRWDSLRKSILKQSEQWPWKNKSSKGFFRGSRTSEQRDSLILLSRNEPELVDAAYTKNQAWKSEKDTLFAPPADEVSLENHCQYKYLFNFRGVAASFRFKHLFLCKSLVFHVGEDWKEFFYQFMKPWYHYVPINPNASEKDIKNILLFFKEHDDLAKEISERGYRFIRTHLRMKDITWYWETLLQEYAKLLKYKPKLDNELNLVNR